jgi:hypothetical protein
LARKKAEAKIVKLVLIKEGTFHIPVTKTCAFGPDENYVTIEYPLMIRGAGQEKTIIHGGFQIVGTKEEKKRVDMQGMTMKGSSRSGLKARNGLSFLCKDMTFTQCGWHGVAASNTKGRLINCVVTQCGDSGILSGDNALIELEGDQTKVDGNVTDGISYYYGLAAYVTSSTIHLLFPLTKESVSLTIKVDRILVACLVVLSQQSHLLTAPTQQAPLTNESKLHDQKEEFQRRRRKKERI